MKAQKTFAPGLKYVSLLKVQFHDYLCQKLLDFVRKYNQDLFKFQQDKYHQNSQLTGILRDDYSAS